MAEVRIGIIGSGGMAARRAAQFAQCDPCVLQAVAARSPDTGAALAERHHVRLHQNWRELVERDDVDAVAICTYNESHGRMAIGALEAGKHVFTEYPLARHLHEVERLAELVSGSDFILRVAHSPVSAKLQEAVSSLGPLLQASFTRLTPGRGARPEVLFNLELSGPPALFFIYHIYPLIYLFGPASWVSASDRYIDLQENGSYQRFTNSVSTGFLRGGLAQWTWCGGIAIRKAEEFQQIVLENGSLLRSADDWQLSTPDRVEVLSDEEGDSPSLESCFLADILDGDTTWREDFSRAVDAVRLSLAAEASMLRKRRIFLSEM